MLSVVTRCSDFCGFVKLQPPRELTDHEKIAVYGALKKWYKRLEATRKCELGGRGSMPARCTSLRTCLMLRSTAEIIGIPAKALLRVLKRGMMRRFSAALKPLLTDKNKNDSLKCFMCFINRVLFVRCDRNILPLQKKNPCLILSYSRNRCFRKLWSFEKLIVHATTKEGVLLAEISICGPL